MGDPEFGGPCFTDGQLAAILGCVRFVAVVAGVVAGVWLLPATAWAPLATAAGVIGMLYFSGSTQG